MTTTRERPAPGSIGWVDLTVPNAEVVQAFYRDVVGWRVKPLSMGGYDDYVMESPTRAAPVAGVCHARGENADLPPHWLIYFAVDDLDRSIEQCRQRGGTVVSGPRSCGEMGRFCVVKDPAGAHAALLQPPD